jgi:inhibitor of cysteine peptidase
MKKFFVPAMTLLIAGCLIAGCGGVIKTYTDTRETIGVGINQEFIIALDSNPTTGYNWEESHDANLLSLVEQKYEPSEKAAGLVGAGGTQYFRFKALKEGKTEITLNYKRPWETGIAEQKVFNVSIK